MKCNEIKELLSLYIDGMLDEGERKEVEEHLSACLECRKEYDELSEMVALLGQAGTAPVPDAFSFRLKKALKEEKQNMIDAGLINRPSKKKHQWRIITSVAAVFAVGVLSFGLYHDVLGNLPGKGGGEQAGAVQTDEYGAVKDSGTADTARSKAVDSNSTSDGSVVMKDQSSDLAPLAKTFDSAASDETQNSNTTNRTMTAAAPPDDSAAGLSGGTAGQDNSEQAETYGAASGSESPAGTGSAVTDNVTESQASNGVNGFAQDTPMLGKTAPAPEEECSRSLTSAGVERNAAAVQYYNKLIEEKLKDFDYQVLSSSYTQSGEWQFRIFIFRGKDGNTYNEEITIIGKEGEISIIYTDEFPGL